jgi:hypothetical protein
MLNEEGPRSPGSAEFTVTLNAALVPCAFAIVICWLPVGTVEGTRAFTRARDARANEFSAYAGTWKSDDPARALYFGIQGAKLERPLPPGLEANLATAVTN